MGISHLNDDEATADPRGHDQQNMKTIYAIAVPKGRNVHEILIQEGMSWHEIRNQPARCGARCGDHWNPIDKEQVDNFPTLYKSCKACAKESAERAASPPEPTSAVFCAHCGKPSDRGFIRACRACSGMNG
jgi:hypothetical protein